MQSSLCNSQLLKNEQCHKANQLNLTEANYHNAPRHNHTVRLLDSTTSTWHLASRMNFPSAAFRKCSVPLPVSPITHHRLLQISLSITLLAHSNLKFHLFKNSYLHQFNPPPSNFLDLGLNEILLSSHPPPLAAGLWYSLFLTTLLTRRHNLFIKAVSIITLISWMRLTFEWPYINWRLA